MGDPKVVLVRKRTVDEVGDHDAEGDHDLEQTSDAPPDIFGRAFGDVGGRDGGDAADAEAGGDAACVDESDAVRAAAGDSRQDLEGRAVRENTGLCGG
jgi:hypothetical protein